MTASRELESGPQATVLRVLIPVALALGVGGLLLLALGKNPLDYYGYVIQRSLLRWRGASRRTEHITFA